jgi:hypothetical protein
MLLSIALVTWLLLLVVVWALCRVAAAGDHCADARRGTFESAPSALSDDLAVTEPPRWAEAQAALK